MVSIEQEEAEKPNVTYYYDDRIYIDDSSQEENVVPVFKEFAENVYDAGALTAAGKTININNGTIQIIEFDGYTGSATISITGQSRSTTKTQTVTLMFDNINNNTPPTVIWSGVIWSDQSGAPDFTGTSDRYDFVTLSYVVTFGYWFGSSQMTYSP